jgi:hypothetical protein
MFDALSTPALLDHGAAGWPQAAQQLGEEPGDLRLRFDG